jgi:hypothetical protein
VIVLDCSQLLLIVNEISQQVSIVSDRPWPRRPFPLRNKEEKRHTSGLSAAPLAAAAVPFLTLSYKYRRRSLRVGVEGA